MSVHPPFFWELVQVGLNPICVFARPFDSASAIGGCSICDRVSGPAQGWIPARGIGVM